MPRKTLILDSTQISTYLECPVKHQLEFEENLAVSNEVSDAITAGSYGHKLLEIYYTHKDQNLKKAVELALAFDPGKEFPLPPDKLQLVRDRFNLYWMKYSNNDFKPLIRPTKSIQIIDGIPKDTISQEPFVEKGFSYELLNTSEYLFVLEGRIDLLTQMSGYNIFVDHKFQFRERSLYPGTIQFKNYAMVTGCNIGIINYIRLHQAIGQKTFVRETCNFDSNTIRWWKEELIDIYVRIARSQREHNWDSCGGKFGYHCPYVPICEVHKNPQLVKVEKSRFVTRKEWKPW